VTALRWADLQRAVAARRQLVSALLAGLAVLAALSAVRPAAPPSVDVLAAARDLAAGSALALPDLRTVALPRAAVPAGALRPGAAVLGRLVAGPVRQGEPLTDVRLLGPALLAAVGRAADRATDMVAVPVRFADAGAAALLRPGDRIDVLAAPDPTSSGLAAADLPPPDDTSLDPAPGPVAHAAPAAPGPAPPARPAAPGPTDPVGPTAALPAEPAPARDPRATARVVAADVAVLVVAATDPAGPTDGALVVVACTRAVARALAAANATDRLSPVLRAPTARSP
jgi:Flp pilus assembly protein CpaB